MKFKKENTGCCFNKLSNKTLSYIVGGNDEGDKIVYINGKPYIIKTNSDGTKQYIPM